MKIEDRKSRFLGWHDIIIPMGKPIFAYGVVSAPDLQPEIKQWLVENIGPTGRTTWVHAGCDKHGRHIVIKRSDQAMMFKLAWA